MPNKDLGIPVSTLGNRIIQQKFPADFPIFWGPKQETKYPSEYNEPSGWKVNELLTIPKVARIIESQKTELWIAVGYFNYAHTVWHQQGRADGVFDNTDVPVTPGLISYYYLSAFIETFDITKLGANKSTDDVLSTFRVLDEELDKSDAINQPIFSNEYAGYVNTPIFGMVENTGNAPIGEPESILGKYESPPAASDPSVKWTKSPQTLWAFIHKIFWPDGRGGYSLELFTASGFDAPVQDPKTASILTFPRFPEIHDISDLVIP